VGHKVSLHGRKHLDEHHVPELVEDLVSLLSTENKLLRAKNGQMLGKIRWLHADVSEKAAHWQFAFTETLDDMNASRMRQDLEHTRLKAPQGLLLNSL
jgi:HEAT repeat protein